jgi:hypothetical protein
VSEGSPHRVRHAPLSLLSEGVSAATAPRPVSASLLTARIANVLRASGCPVPSYMLDLQAPSKNTKRQLAKAPPKRKAVGGGGRDVGKEDGKKRWEMKEGSKRRKAGGPDGERAPTKADGGKATAGEVNLDE